MPSFWWKCVKLLQRTNIKIIFEHFCEFSYNIRKLIRENSDYQHMFKNLTKVQKDYPRIFEHILNFFHDWLSSIVFFLSFFRKKCFSAPDWRMISYIEEKNFHEKFEMLRSVVNLSDYLQSVVALFFFRNFDKPICWIWETKFRKLIR